MQRAAIYHANTAPWASPVADDALRLVLWAAAGDLRRAAVLYSDRYGSPEAVRELEREASDGEREYWAATVPAPTRRLRYRFVLEGRDGSVLHLGEDGGHAEWRATRPCFQYPYIQAGDRLRLPGWLPGAVFYQVFPTASPTAIRPTTRGARRPGVRRRPATASWAATWRASASIWTGWCSSRSAACT